MIELRSIAYGLVGGLIFYYCISAIYNLCINPLCRLPGPHLYAISFIPFIWHTLRGRRHLMQHELHKKYGDTVRFTPFHVSFCNESAFKDILTKKPSRGQLMKDPYAYNSLVRNGVHSILTVPSDTEHSRYRRLLSHGFSEKALKEQEPLLLRYVDLLIFKLQEHVKDGKPQDMVAWFNWTTFDLTGSLTFNDSFDCLESASYHPWVQFIFGNIKAGATITALKFMPVANWIITKLFGKIIREKQSQNAKFTAEKVAHRLKSQTDCTDFFEYIINTKEGSEKMSRAEIEAASSILVLGGSETSATLLAGATYLLLQHPRVLQRVKAEVRDHFKSEEEINSASVKELPYLLAVIDESLRIFPPVPTGSPRTIPAQGDTINGYYLPAKTIVVGNIYGACHSSRNWVDADSFIPERWLGEARYETDARGAFQPFSHGPRNCIGKSLAYTEMRLIMARILWHFDMELAESSIGWMENMKVYSLWEKPPLMVKLRPRDM